MHILRLPRTQKEKTARSETGLQRIKINRFFTKKPSLYYLSESAYFLGYFRGRSCFFVDFTETAHLNTSPSDTFKLKRRRK